MYETAIRELEQKLVEKDRALLAKPSREKVRAIEKKCDKNEQIQLPEKPKCTIQRKQENTMNACPEETREHYECDCSELKNF